MEDSSLNDALRHFESTEANLAKAEKVLDEIESEIPNGIAFVGDSPEYESNCRSFIELVDSLPAIDGWKPKLAALELDEIAQMRMDAQELGEIECQVSVERQITDPSRLLREYRHQFNRKRQELIRGALEALIDRINDRLRDLTNLVGKERAMNEAVEDKSFEALKSDVDQIATLLGSSVEKPPRWSDLMRHLGFGQFGDCMTLLNTTGLTLRLVFASLSMAKRSRFLFKLKILVP